jgi:5-hydroxyisourate hydrolase
MSAITTHVLDTSRGAPASDMDVVVHAWQDGGWSQIGAGRTDADGRVAGLLPDGPAEPGTYRLTFATGEWFAAEKIDGFYPEVTVVFSIHDRITHYHIPLLISPFAYSTYRGS